MTNNDNEFDIDIDNQDDDGGFDKGAPAGSALKEAWDSNPLLKIAAVVLGIAVLAGGYFAFVETEVEEKNKSIIGGRSTTGVKIAPGSQVVDQAYEEAIRKTNEKNIEIAKTTGGSAMPISLGTAKEEQISLPVNPADRQEDPLAEWRRKAEMRRKQQEELIPEEEGRLAPQQPDIVPLVQPIRPQPVMKVDPNAAKALAGQMRVIISSQVPLGARQATITARPSAFNEMLKQEKMDAAEGAIGGAASSSSQTTGVVAVAAVSGGPNKEAKPEVIVPAGSIAYAQLLNELNSDVPGPALAHILSGPFAGGRAIGQFSVQNDFLTLQFSTIVKDGVSYPISGIALDEKTTLSGHQSDVDRHYFTRIILPAAAKFVEGYAAAVAETGTTSTVNNGSVIQDQPEPDAKEELYKGMEEASKSVSEVMQQNSNRPITVKVYKGTTMGILFMQTVTTGVAR